MCHCRQVKCEIYDRWKGKETKNNFHLIFSPTPPSPQYIQFLLILKNVVHDKRWNKKSEGKKVSWKSFNHEMWAKQKHITRVAREKRRANCNNCQEIIVKFISILTVFKWEKLDGGTKTHFTLLRDVAEGEFHMSKYVLDEHFIMPAQGRSFQLFLSPPPATQAANIWNSGQNFVMGSGGECKSLVITNFNFTESGCEHEDERNLLKSVLTLICSTRIV
jgi:hypothetical protein